MKAGKVASLIVALVFGAVSATAGILAFDAPGLHDWLEGKGFAFRCFIMFSVPFLTSLALLIPLGFSLDRTILRLRRHFENDSAVRDMPSPTGPRWLRPVVGAFAAAADRFARERKELRQELREVESERYVVEAQKNRSEAVLQTLRDAVIITDAEDQIVMINDAAEEIFNIRLSDVIHKPLREVIAEEKLADLIRDTRQTGEIGENHHRELQMELPDENGPKGAMRNAIFDVCLVCVEGQSEEEGGVVAIFHDLTRERELSELKTDFVSKASHELRTPLSSIRAYIEMLIDGEASDKASRQEFYRVIQDETERLSRLIDNMLNISRIEAGIVQVERQQVDIHQLVERVVTTMTPHVREKNISLTIKPSTEDLVVDGDVDMLLQVMLNLVSNAVKYTPKQGSITIATELDTLSRSVIVSVLDTGMGVPPDLHQLIFDKFYRIDNYKQLAKGTGLGLTLCKHIVETLHYGHIGVESKLGMGAKFWFSIPIKYIGSRTAA